MNSVMKKAMELVFERYFCPETELFYEFVIDDENNAWFHLPSVKEINKQIPNPCGWGTGMEDSAMNGGNAIDALISAYNVTGNEEIKSYVHSIFRGLMRCAVSEKNEGFIARSISPFDKKSHYIESSRDQYTHWIYGVLRFYDSDICSENERKQIREAVERIARKCQRDVKPENDYHMLREDGSIGIVNKMWGDLGAHEWMRLPMFYLAAFHVTENTHWYDMYMMYRDEAFEKSLLHEPASMACYTSLQMQCSLKLVYDYDNDIRFCSEVKKLMEKLACYGAEKAIYNSKEYCKDKYRQDINFRFRRWNSVEPYKLGIHGGYNYDNPAQSERPDNPMFYPVREVAEGALMATTCPDFRISEDLIEAVDNMAKSIDFGKHSSIYAPLLLSCAYITCTEKILQYKK